MAPIRPSGRIRRLLIDDAADPGLLVAVSDAAGRPLWVEGCPSLRARAEGMHFVPGADWSEASAGTNAPGTALAVGEPVQIFGPEHLVRQVTPWSPQGAFLTGDSDVLLGRLEAGTPEPVDVWMSAEQFELWKHTHRPSTWCRAEAPGSRWRRRPDIVS